jgi:hypothetical protein
VKISFALGIAGALGAGCSAFLMIGGGGSTAYRAAADVIGTPPIDVEGREAIGLGDEAGAVEVFGGKLGVSGRGAAGAGAGRGANGGADRSARSTTTWPVLSGMAMPSPRKSPTRFSTNWLIEIPFVSQNALSLSYVERLTLMLRRVCFFAMMIPYATGRVPSRTTY